MHPGAIPLNCREYTPLITDAGVDKYYDAGVTFDEDHNQGKYDTLIIGHHQEFPEEWLDSLTEQRKTSTDAAVRAGEMEQVACIPVIIVEKWRREGFDIFNENVEAIVKRLKAEDLTAFLTNDRQLY